MGISQKIVMLKEQNALIVVKLDTKKVSVVKFSLIMSDFKINLIY